MPIGALEAYIPPVPSIQALYEDATTRTAGPFGAEGAALAALLRQLAPAHCGGLPSAVNEVKSTAKAPRTSNAGQSASEGESVGASGSASKTTSAGESASTASASDTASAHATRILRSAIANLDEAQSTQSRLRGTIEAMQFDLDKVRLSFATAVDGPALLATMEPDAAVCQTVSAQGRTVDIILLACEAKSSILAPGNALTQAAIAGCTGVLQLQAAGVPYEHCVVPMIAYSAVLEQHAVAYALPNGHPSIAIISRCLDLTCAEDARAAARFRTAERRHVERTCRELAKIPVQAAAERVYAQAHKRKCGKLVYRFDADEFFLKTPNSRHCVTNTDLDLSTSARETLEVFEALRRAKVPCVYPLGCVPVLEAVEVEVKKDSQDPELEDEDTWDPELVVTTGAKMVFENKKDFTCGLPSSGTSDFYSWLRASIAAISSMHAAGVVHLDMHPFNILHRILPGGAVEVLLIDFDGALLRSEPVPASLIAQRSVGSWGHAFPTCLLTAGGPADTLVDWYYLSGVLLCFLQGKGSSFRGKPRKASYAVLKQVLARHRDALLECCGLLEEDEGVQKALAAFHRLGLFRADEAREYLPDGWTDDVAAVSMVLRSVAL